MLSKSVSVIANHINGMAVLALLVKYSMCGFVELSNSCVIWYIQLVLFLGFHSHDDGKSLLTSGSGRKGS